MSEEKKQGTEGVISIFEGHVLHGQKATLIRRNPDAATVDVRLVENVNKIFRKGDKVTLGESEWRKK